MHLAHSCGHKEVFLKYIQVHEMEEFHSIPWIWQCNLSAICTLFHGTSEDPSYICVIPYSGLKAEFNCRTESNFMERLTFIFQIRTSATVPELLQFRQWQLACRIVLFLDYFRKARCVGMEDIKILFGCLSMNRTIIFQQKCWKISVVVTWSQQYFLDSIAVI